jgi:uncharacterized protein YkwD
VPLRFISSSYLAARRRNTSRVAARCKVAGAALFVLASLPFAPRAAHAAPQVTSAERALFDAANRERAAQGLPALRWDDALAAAARQHAALMAQRNTLSHQLRGEPPVEERARQAGARYSVIAENVAEGPSPEAIHSSWMHSPPHRANLLDRDLTAVGIAVAVVADRRTGGTMLFAVQDFSQSVANLSFEEQERQVSALLAARGLQVFNGTGQGTNVAGATEDARKTCGKDRGWAGSRPGLVVRYEVPDLSRLPNDLEQKIQSGRYRAAAVGACDSGTRGFTRFRIAVLLF